MRCKKYALVKIILRLSFDKKNFFWGGVNEFLRYILLFWAFRGSVVVAVYVCVCVCVYCVFCVCVCVCVCFSKSTLIEVQVDIE